jgi:hypothetical protein
MPFPRFVNVYVKGKAHMQKSLEFRRFRTVWALHMRVYHDDSPYPLDPVSLICGVILIAVTPPVLAQAPAATVLEDDAAPQPTEPDFTLINLPTTLGCQVQVELPPDAHAFREPARWDVWQAAEQSLRLDNGAAIGFEYRFAIATTCSWRLTAPTSIDRRSSTRRSIRLLKVLNACLLSGLVSWRAVTTSGGITSAVGAWFQEVGEVAALRHADVGA